MVKNSTKSNVEPQDEEIVQAAAESQRLQDLAMEQGILSRTRRIAGTALPPTANLAKADGKDIVKRSSARRSRYLLVFNCQLAPAAAGRLGTLARLDTRNPVMYIDFPEGRLRLQGTLTFPRNKYLVLRTGNKEVLCEDVLESIVVFSEAHWVGTVEENPSEVPLPMPESLRTNKPHGAVDFGARSGGHLDVGTQDVDEVPEDDAGDAVPASQGTRRVSRHQSKKRQRYAEDSDASAGDESSDEENGVEEVKRLPKKKAAADKGKKAAAAPRGRRSSGGNSQLASQSQPEVVEIDLVGGISDDEDEPLAARGAKQRPLADYFKKAAPAKKSAKPGKKKDASDDEEVNLVSSDDDDNDDENDEIDQALPASQRPKRAAAGVASKRLRVEAESSEGSGSDSDSDEDQGGSGEEGSDDDDESSDGYEPSE